MSQPLSPLVFPLHGSRLIEASAGTGKTWTIAALYVRLVLGHGSQPPVQAGLFDMLDDTVDDTTDDALTSAEQDTRQPHTGFARPLLPAQILVMTFTRAATKELSERIRQRLVEAAKAFRGETKADDPFLAELLDAYSDDAARQNAAHLLALAAEAMDEAAIFTIDAWCQRMLREHAFDSGCLFDEELVESEEAIFRHAVRDYWRDAVYALDAASLLRVRQCWADLPALETSIRGLVERVDCFDVTCKSSLSDLVARCLTEQQQQLSVLKAGWVERASRMQDWITEHHSRFNGNRLRKATVANCLDAIRSWAETAESERPGEGFDKGWDKLVPKFLQEVCKEPALILLPDFEAIRPLHDALAKFEPLAHHLQRHAAVAIAARIDHLKQQSRQFGFADMLTRLRTALEGENGPALQQRILERFPVALIDEFQDTSPDQYRIFDCLYRIADCHPATGLFLIGDPKQAIYGFRGADIHSYLAARQATTGRHYRLDTNYRSTTAVVAAVNHLFLHAEGEGEQDRKGHPAGAFHFRLHADNPLPFEAVKARGRVETLVTSQGPVPALSLWCQDADKLNTDKIRRHFAAHCAEQIVMLLNDPEAGFQKEGQFTRLQPADIAVLVRDRNEAAAVRRALLQRAVPSVYLSDKDSVFDSDEAADVLRWLKAVASPLDGQLARAAFATRTAGLELVQLFKLASDDLAWEARIEQLKALQLVWQRQGVLAMLRRFIHELGLPVMLLRQPGGERALTDLLHLAELLQTASQGLDGEQALIRWLLEQIDNDTASGDERILRLESDADLVKVVTVHKSKGLEYPLVFLPFATACKPVTKKKRHFFEVLDKEGRRRLDLSLSEASKDIADGARLEEDLRLLYVALTRARHALWLGIAAPERSPKLEQSAFGYLMTGGAALKPAELLVHLEAMCAPCADIQMVAARIEAHHTRLARGESLLPLRETPQYAGRFERNWSIASYTSITRDLGIAHVPATAQEEKLLAEDDMVEPGAAGAAAAVDTGPKQEDLTTLSAAWHSFPRGAVPGQFMHGQLEWIANEGFEMVEAADFTKRVGMRCERAGWGHRQEETAAWLQATLITPLPALDCALIDLTTIWPEMEFWVPMNAFATAGLDALCQTHLLEGRARPQLQTRQLNGMLRGFKDLVFECEGRYWVLDYKTNALGINDAAYHADALMDSMAQHRYDVQGAIYLLALHRLLQSRLGATYDPEKHLGGAIFYFMRGVHHPVTRGCYHLLPDRALLAEADALLGKSQLEALDSEELT